MDDFDEYDEFGNYIGPTGTQGTDGLVQHIDFDDDGDDDTVQIGRQPGASSLDDDISTQPASNLSAHHPAQPIGYDPSVEIIVGGGDSLAQHQSLMKASRLTDLDDPLSGGYLGTKAVPTAGYGSVNDYQASFCLSESTMPPLSVATPTAYPDLVHSLLSEQWLQRHFSVIGGHLHGKTALLDLFFSQLHPHVEVQSITPETPALSGAPHNLKPTTAFAGTFDPATQANATITSRNRTRNCWPVQYADSLFRERAVGHSTSLKPITMPVQVAMPFTDISSRTIPNPLASAPATKTYLFSMTDTPAHSNFIDPTVTAIQRCSSSGVVLVVDCVEGMTSEIELQLEYAVRSALPMLLVLTKLDRLITELRVLPKDAYLKLVSVIESVNTAVLQYHTMYYGVNAPATGQSDDSDDADPDAVVADSRYLCPLFNPSENNVVFTSTLHTWAFTIKSFAMLYLTQQDIQASRGVVAPSATLGANPNLPPPPTNFNTNSTSAQKLQKLTRLFWGDVCFDTQTKQFLTYPARPAPGSGPANQTSPNRTFVEFILNPLYKMYSACLTGNAAYLEAILGSFYQPLPALPPSPGPARAPSPAHSGAMNDDDATAAAATGTATATSRPFGPFAIPPHILASSQDDLLRELIGLWLFAPFHLSAIHQRSRGGYRDDEFSVFSPLRPPKPKSKSKPASGQRSSTPSASQTLLSNAACAAQLLSAVVLDVLPPPVLRKAFIQKTTLLYQPPLSPIGPAAPLSALPSHQAALAQTHPHTRTSVAALKPVNLPADKYFPPCRVGLADVITVVPHPNGTTLDFLCRVHTLAMNNDPLFVDQEEDLDPHGTTKSRVAFRVGDRISLFRTKDKTYCPPQELVGIFAPCANRYRIPLPQCYDGNIVVLSFSTQSANPGADSAPHANPIQSDPILLQKLFPTTHGTFINHTVTPLGGAQRTTKGATQPGRANPAQPQPLLDLDQLNIKPFIPTFCPPVVHPGPDVFNIAIEPTVASELPVLLSTLQRAQSLYGASLKVTQEATGTHTLSMRGEFLADDVLHYLRVVTGQLPLASSEAQRQKRKVVPPNLHQLSFVVSVPFYNFREGVRGESACDCFASSVGGHNKVTAIATSATSGPSSNVTEAQSQFARSLDTHHDNLFLANQYNHYLQWSSRPDSLHLTEPSHMARSMNAATAHHMESLQAQRGAGTETRIDRESLVFGSNRLFSTYHAANKSWDAISFSNTPWSFGLLDDANVQLLDETIRGSHRSEDESSLEDFLAPSRWKFDHVASVVNGFNRLALEGPLTESPLHNMSMSVVGLDISPNPLQSTSRHLIPAARKALSGAMLLATPTLYEPMIQGEIIISKRFDAEVNRLLGARRGAVLSTIPIPLTPYTRYVYKLPAIESAGFGVEARVIAKGQSRLSGGYHLNYEMMQGDPLDVNIPVLVVKVAAIGDLPRDLMTKTRRRKGLPEFVPQNFFDQEMLARFGDAE